MMKIAVVMDAPADMKPWKDSSFAMLLAAQVRGHECDYIDADSLFIDSGIPMARAQPITVQDNRENFYELGAGSEQSLTDYDLILMRKDPPFDMRYVMDTYVLDLASAAGTLVVNRPEAIRNFNEKLAITRFPQHCVPTLVSASTERLRAFVNKHENCIVKPLDAMGGHAIFRARQDDDNLPVILETITANQTQRVMIQTYIDAIREGDRRVLLIDGVPVPNVLARIPGGSDFRGNLARGGRGVARPISDGERAICAVVGPVLREHGIAFAGLDVIGDRLTEINVTSPTCIREIDAQCESDIAGDLIEHLERRVRSAHAGAHHD